MCVTRVVHTARARAALLGAAALGLAQQAALRSRAPCWSTRAVAPARPSLARHASAYGAPGAAVASALVRNGEAIVPGMEKGELLQRFSGAYTTARTVDGRAAVFELLMHCARLHDTATSVLRRALGDAGEAASCQAQALEFLEKAGPEALAPLVRREIAAALQELEGSAQGGASDDEVQVTMLLTCDAAGPHTPPGRGFDIFTYVQPMPPLPAMVDVEAHAAKRPNPTIKDVQWVNDRQHLEAVQREAGVNEVVMFDGEGAISEGLQTNFFAVAPGAYGEGLVLQTAPDESVLAGTVRKVVLDVAREHSIPVKFQAPNIRELDSWESCFICSTSRMVKPVRQLRAPSLEVSGGEVGAVRSFPADGSLAHRVEALVLGAVKTHSQPLASPE